MHMCAAAAQRRGSGVDCPRSERTGGGGGLGLGTHRRATSNLHTRPNRWEHHALREGTRRASHCKRQHQFPSAFPKFVKAPKSATVPGVITSATSLQPAQALSLECPAHTGAANPGGSRCTPRAERSPHTRTAPSCKYHTHTRSGVASSGELKWCRAKPSRRDLCSPDSTLCSVRCVSL